MQQPWCGGWWRFISVDCTLQNHCLSKALGGGDHKSLMDTIKLSLYPPTYTHTYIIIVHIHIHYISSLRVIFQLGHSHSILSLIWGKTAGIDSYQAATAITRCLCLIQSFTLICFQILPWTFILYIFFWGGGYWGLISDHYTRVDKLSGFDVFVHTMLFVHTEKAFFGVPSQTETKLVFPVSRPHNTALSDSEVDVCTVRLAVLSQLAGVSKADGHK